MGKVKGTGNNCEVKHRSMYMKMRTVLLTSMAVQVGFAGLIVAARSADLPVKNPPMPVAYAPVCDWCGVEVGVEGGAVFDGFSLNGVGPGFNRNPSSYQIGGFGEVMHQFTGTSVVALAGINVDYGHPSDPTIGAYWRGTGWGGLGLALPNKFLWAVKGGIVGERAAMNLFGTGSNVGAFGWMAGTEIHWRPFGNGFDWKMIDYQFSDLNGLQVGPISTKNTSHSLKTGIAWLWN